MNFSHRLERDFFTRDILDVAPDLVGKILVIRSESGQYKIARITEVEAYRGIEDKACHASKGRTRRTEIMYHTGGHVYVYFVYGMYWMFNIVAGGEGNPQAALIRSVEGLTGPGRLTRTLGIDGSFYGEDLTVSDRIWIEANGRKCGYKKSPRIGIGYAGKPWTDKLWRFYI